jgi:hypothetical protein
MESCPRGEADLRAEPRASGQINFKYREIA